MDRDPMDRRDEPDETPLEAAAAEVRRAEANVKAAQKRLKDAEAALLKLARGA